MGGGHYDEGPNGAILRKISNNYDNVTLARWGADRAHPLIVFDPAYNGGARGEALVLRNWPEQVPHNLKYAKAKMSYPRDPTGLRARMSKKNNVYRRLYEDHKEQEAAAPAAVAASSSGLQHSQSAPRLDGATGPKNLTPWRLGATRKFPGTPLGAPPRRPTIRGLVTPIRTATGGFANPTEFDMMNAGT